MTVIHRRAYRSVWIMLAVLLLLALSAADSRGAVPAMKGDPQGVQEVQAALQKFSAARTWRTRISGGGSGGAITTTEYVAPDRFHLTITQGTERTEMFLIGRQFWMRTATGCNKPPFAVPIMNPKEMMEHSSADTIITVSRTGPVTVEGTATQSYALVVESKGDTTREKLFVANETGFPRRIEVESSRGPVVIDYADFNAPITINDPPC